MSDFRSVDRDTGFLMPPSVDEWLPEHHPARFIVEVVDGLDLRTMRGAYRGSGSASYAPSLLLGQLVYGYATGVFSQGNRRLPRQTRRRLASIRFEQTEQNESGHGNRRLKLSADLVPSVPEIRYLLARIFLRPALDPAFILGWSCRRRRHQNDAAQAHYRKRQQRQL